MAQASAHLARLAGVDTTLDAIAADLLEIQYQVGGVVARACTPTWGGSQSTRSGLRTVDERLRLYTDLARKYGGSTEAALDYLDRSRERLSHLERMEEDLRDLAEARAAHCALALDLAAQLSRRRREAVPLLEEAVGRQLADLGMPEAKLTVDSCASGPTGRVCGRAGRSRLSSC